MFIPIVNICIIDLLAVILLIRFRAVNYYTINILIGITYNFLGWAYISKYLDAGGASLGPGLLLIAITVAHFILMFAIAAIKYFVVSVRRKV
nr:hypothetical protein [uncultured Mucilaginibacter sp.]